MAGRTGQAHATLAIFGTGPIGRLAATPGERLGVQVIEITIRPCGEEGVADIANCPFDPSLLISPRRSNPDASLFVFGEPVVRSGGPRVEWRHGGCVGSALRHAATTRGDAAAHIHRRSTDCRGRRLGKYAPSGRRPRTGTTDGIADRLHRIPPCTTHLGLDNAVHRGHKGDASVFSCEPRR